MNNSLLKNTSFVSGILRPILFYFRYACAVLAMPTGIVEANLAHGSCEIAENNQ